MRLTVPPFPDFRVVVGNYNFGDDGGSQGAFTIFTITGDVLLQVFGICDLTLVGVNATVELGITGDTAVVIAQTTGIAVQNNEVWTDASPTVGFQQIDVDGARTFIDAGGQDIILTIATADLTAGDIDFYALWRPLSSDGQLVAA